MFHSYRVLQSRGSIEKGKGSTEVGKRSFREWNQAIKKGKRRTNWKSCQAVSDELIYDGLFH